MAFDSTSNISLSKPTISFSVNSWFLATTLANVTLSASLISDYITNTTLPNITILSYVISDNAYTTNIILKNPNISFVASSPNIYTLSSTLSKPILSSLQSLNISGIVNYRIPPISINSNTVFVSTITKQTWVFNTITTAHSRYTNYNFNSFFKLGSDNYGINTNGSIYKLTGAKDFVGEVAEADIVATITLPASTFESQNLKSCSDAIIYGRGNGDMEVQIVLDEQQARVGYTIHFDDKEGMHRKRVMPPIPKGLKGNVWQYILKNIDGSWFDINMFEVFIRELQRIK